MRKRIISIVLCLCLLLSLTPVLASAASENPFTDVKESDWFYDAVLYALDKGLMQGTGAATFEPATDTSRGMIVTILHNLEGKPEAESAGFEDVADGAWYAAAVNWAKANGVVKGYSDSAFGPNDPITREQLAVILYQYAALKGFELAEGADLSAYADAESVHDWAAEGLAWANAEGLITGVKADTLAPLGKASRAQTATVFMRFCQRFGAAEAETVKVTFDLNYSGAAAPETVEVVKGETVAAPKNPTRFGYTFNGWFTAKAGGVKYDFTKAVEADVTVYALWKTVSYGGGGYVPPTPTTSPDGPFTVTFESNGGSPVAAQTVAKGATAAKPADPTREGYRFVAWYSSVDLVVLYDFSDAVNSNVTLYARWEQLQSGETTPLDEKNDGEILSFRAEPYDVVYNVGGEVTFIAEVAADSVPNQVYVVGEDGTILGQMTDPDGDGFFTYVASFGPRVETGTERFKVKIGEAESYYITIGFYQVHSSEELNEYDRVTAKIDEVLAPFIDTNGFLIDESQFAVAANAVETALSDDVAVKQIIINTDEQCIAVILVSGARCYYILKNSGFDAVVYSFQPFKGDYAARGYAQLESQSYEATDGSAMRISNTFDRYTFYTLTSDDSLNTSDDNNYDGTEVTLEVLKGLANCDVMSWHGHGGYLFDVGSFMGTGQMYSQQMYEAYASDFDTSRLVTINNRIWMTGGFIEKYAGDMTGHFYYLGTCSSGRDMLDNTTNDFELAQAFLNKGATAVIGNSADIYTDYNTKMERTVFEYLCTVNSATNQYYTLGEALDGAKRQHGNDDGHGTRVVIFPENRTAATDFRLLNSGEVSGAIRSAENSSPVSGAMVRIYDMDNRLVASKRSGSSGIYSLSIVPGRYYLEISAASFKTVKQEITVQENGTTYNETFLLVQNNILELGKANGIIYDANTGAGVPGVTINLRYNLGNRVGAVAYSTTTNANGYYEIEGAIGSYTMQYYKAGYSTGYKTVLLLVDYVAQNAYISPVISEGEYRIVLSWVDHPSDLDSHLTGPLNNGSRFHLYFPYAESNGGSDFSSFVWLNTDNTSIQTNSDKEETHIVQQFDGPYVFSVHDYSNSGSSTSMEMATSNAMVEVYKGSTLVNTYNVPSMLPGSIWVVFELRGDSFTSINRVSYGSSEAIEIFDPYRSN